MTVRLNKLIADSGLCSRREADRLIESGWVTVNKEKVTTLGCQVNPKNDQIRVKGRLLPKRQKIYVLFHKPKGAITTKKDEKKDAKRQTIYDVLPKKYAACDPAGRLDRDSTGALILTNDGDFIYQITHPRFQMEKVYRIRVNRDIQPDLTAHLLSGVPFEEEAKTAKASSVKILDERTLLITLVTGMNRQIRRMLMLLGYKVTSLKRIQFGPVQLGDLPPGKVRPLSVPEIKALTQKGPAKEIGKKPTSKRRTQK